MSKKLTKRDLKNFAKYKLQVWIDCCVDDNAFEYMTKEEIHIFEEEINKIKEKILSSSCLKYDSEIADKAERILYDREFNECDDNED